MNEHLKVIDKLLDIPNVREEDVFSALVKVNSGPVKLSAYDLAKLWNSSDAVKFEFAKGRTANDFLLCDMV